MQRKLIYYSNMSIQKSFIEEKLIQLLKEDSKDAFVQIYDTYWQSLFNHAYKRLPEREIVQELIQDLFTEFWQKRKSLTIHSSLPAYLHQSLKYKVLNHIKAEMVRERYMDYVQNQTTQDCNEVEKVLFFNELHKALKKEIALLSPQSQLVYQLKQEKGLSYKEISQHLKISVSTVEKHMIKALKTLRENLKEYAVSSLFLILFS